MKKVYFLFIFLLLFSFCRASAAEERLGPGIYGGNNPAFGQLNEDITPDFPQITIFPAEPEEGDELYVVVECFVDEYKSENEVERVSLFYSVNEEREFKEINLKRTRDSKIMWWGSIPAQKRGTTIDFYLSAEDSVGNKAIEVPPLVRSFPPEDEDLFLIISDGDDTLKVYPDDLNITDIYAGFDEDNLYLKVKVKGKFSSSYRGKFAYVYGVGVVCPDVRTNPVSWNHEMNSAQFLGYLPLMNKIGFFRNMEGIMEEPKGKIKSKKEGGTLYLSCQRDLISSKENVLGGMKIFAATALANIQKIGSLLSADLENVEEMEAALPEPVDGTNYILVYPRGHRIEVGRGKLK